MFKLCKTCGYINKGNAIECEECHSLLDIDISDSNRNTTNKTKKDNGKLSISSIFKPKKTKLINPEKVHAEEELNIDKNYINDYEINIEDNDIEIIKEEPKPAPVKKEPVEEIKEKPVEEIKQENASINIEKEIIQKDIKVDDNTVSEIEPDESTMSEMFADNDTYNEIPIEDNSEEALPKEEKESDEIPSDNNETSEIEDIEIPEIEPIPVVEKPKDNKIFAPIVKAKPTAQDLFVAEKADELSRIVESIQDNTNLKETSVIQIKEEKVEQTQQVEQDKQTEQVEDTKAVETTIEEDPFVSQINEEERAKQEKIDAEKAKEKQEEDRIKKVVSEALKEVVMQVTEEDGEGLRIRRRRKIMDEEEPEEIAPLINLKMDEPEPAVSRKPKKTITSVKPMELKKRTNDAVNKADADDDTLQDAMDVFESIGSKPTTNTEDDESKKTVVYDLVGTVPKHEPKPAHIATKEDQKVEEKEDKKEESSKKKKLLGGKKNKKDKKIKKDVKERPNLSIVQRSIAISVVLALAIVAVVVVSRINRSKELKVYTNNLVGDQNVSYQQLYDALLEKGYSEKEILGVIADLNIDFNEFALNVLYSAALDTNKLASKKDAENLLIKNGFTASEIDNAMQSADWNNFLTIYINQCVSKKKVLDKKTIMKSIKDAGYSEQEIQFVDNNIDWAKLAKKNINAYTSGEELHTKDDINVYLLDLGYSEKDIAKTFEEYEWDIYAYTYLTKYLEIKEKEGDTIELSRPIYTDILTKAGFSAEEIANVMARYDFAGQATSKVDALITTGKDFVNKSELKKALAKEGYTTEEIEKALAETDWNEAAISSLKSLDNAKFSKNEMLKTLKDAEYSEKELEYATTKYEWTVQGLKYIDYLKSQKKNGNETYLRTSLKEAGYTSDEIDKMIKSLNFEKSVDWFEEAAKNDLNSIKDNDNFTRNKAKQYLTELHYGDKEINSALASISYSDWKRLASNYLSSADFKTRIEAREKLQNEGFINSNENKEIDYALQSVNWTNKCKECARSLYDQNDSDTKCLDYKKYKKQEDGTASIEQSLQLAEFTSDEIRSALNEIFASSPCNIN